MLQVYIREVLGSNFGWYTGYLEVLRGFLEYLR
jgi:hypothetical protein